MANPHSSPPRKRRPDSPSRSQRPSHSDRPPRDDAPREAERRHEPPPRFDRRLTDAERTEAARHLPLVHHHLRRQAGISRRGAVDRDVDDLFQEGCLALLKSVRNFDPRRHGTFAAYALARIHHRVSRTLYEGEGGIRVPLTTRRRKLAAARREGDPRKLPALPREVSMERAVESGAADRGGLRRNRGGYAAVGGDARSADARHDPAAGDGPVLSHLARERYELLARRVAEQMSRQAGGQPDRPQLIAQCLAERWLISEPRERTSLRDLARRMNSSLGRVTHGETDFFRRMHLAMTADPASRWIALRAAEHSDGFRRVLDRDETAEYERVATEKN